MAFLNSLNISGSGLTASRLRMDVISENIANASTTKTENGDTYRRKIVVYESADDSNFSKILNSKLNSSQSATRGVVVTSVVEDQTELTPVYDPTNEAADGNGYVMMPNVDVVEETIDMMSVSRAYQANLTAFNAVKEMASKALELGR